MLQFRPVTEERRSLMPLLLLGDEQENMVERYLDQGEVFAVYEKEKPLGVCVVTDESGGVCELKNIAVDPTYQRKGLGHAMLEELFRRYRGRFRTMLVGTGDSPLTVPFYESCGFRYSHRVPDFFTEHYDHPIYEAGHRLRDMLYFQREL